MLWASLRQSIGQKQQTSEWRVFPPTGQKRTRGLYYPARGWPSSCCDPSARARTRPCSARCVSRASAKQRCAHSWQKLNLDSLRVHGIDRRDSSIALRRPDAPLRPPHLAPTARLDCLRDRFPGRVPFGATVERAFLCRKLERGSRSLTFWTLKVPRGGIAPQRCKMSAQQGCIKDPKPGPPHYRQIYKVR